MAHPVIFGAGLARITLRDSTGADATRYTLQASQAEGLVVAFRPEGVAHELGSGAYNRKDWVGLGIRPSLDIAWDAGIRSVRETWSGAAWTDATYVSTAEAVARILDSSMLYPCLVEPHVDQAWSFEAQPDLQPFELRDIKGVVHVGLKIRLIGQDPVSEPTWLATPVPGGLPAATGDPALMLHLNRSTRVTLFDGDGTRTKRWTLQAPDRGARALSYTPVGQAQVSAVPGRVRSVLFRGWRASLKCQWATTHQASLETWSGSAWGAAVAMPMAEALADILWGSDTHDVEVEPFGAGSFDSFGTFRGRAYANGLSLKSLKSAVHRSLDLVLESADLQATILDPGGFFVDGGMWTVGFGY